MHSWHHVQINAIVIAVWLSSNSLLSLLPIFLIARCSISMLIKDFLNCFFLKIPKSYLDLQTVNLNKNNGHVERCPPNSERTRSYCKYSQVTIWDHMRRILSSTHKGQNACEFILSLNTFQIKSLKVSLVWSFVFKPCYSWEMFYYAAIDTQNNILIAM